MASEGNIDANACKSPHARAFSLPDLTSNRVSWHSIFLLPFMGNPIEIVTDEMILDTAPFMLTRAMHRDVYPAIDPAQNPAVSAEGKVAIVTGATGGLGFVSSSPPPPHPTEALGDACKLI